QQSQATGITPPSLEILDMAGLGPAFIQSGVRIQDCHVHGRIGRVGRVSFRNLEGAYRFILSLPQRQTMQILEQALAQEPAVTLIRGVEVLRVTQKAEGVLVQARDVDYDFNAAYVVACDGWRSGVREMLGIRTRRRDYGCHFVMGDFIDRTTLGDEAHVFFTPAGAVESFPLPGGQRRWIVQTDEPKELIPQVRQRAGCLLNEADQLNESAFSPLRIDCRRMREGRVLLCGDAAHVMSPIGGQGMNTGFADAEFAAEALHGILRYGENAERWLHDYERCRQKSARSAARRAEWGMGLGVWRGQKRSLLRDFLFRHVLLRGPLSSHLPPWFAMQSLPCNRLKR
ncbi:MAG: FAD-dependent oxidoreductase, partial [Prosthecobacter sp.]